MEEKRFDPYQFIGFVLIALILTWMLYVNRPGEKVISDAQSTNTETVILRRDTPQTQTMDLIDNDPMSADTIETAHDKSIAIAQELQEQIDRSLKISRTNKNSRLFIAYYLNNVRLIDNL